MKKINPSELLAEPSDMIFLGSAVGYLGAYLFEVGYITFFGFGHQTAQVELSSFILMTFVAVPILLYALPLHSVYMDIVKKLNPKSKKHRKLKDNIQMSGLLVIFVVPFALYFSWWLMFLIFIPWLTDYSIRIFEGKFKKFKKKSGPFKRALFYMPSIRVPKKYRGYIARTGFALLFVSSLFFSAGNIYARIQTSFKAYNRNGSTFIVIREYGNKILSAELNTDKNGLINSYRILNVPDGDGGFEFRTIYIKDGPKTPFRERH